MKQWLHCMLFLLATLPFTAHTATSCPPTHQQAHWMAACFEQTGAERRVKARYLHNIRFNKTGVAILNIEQPHGR